MGRSVSSVLFSAIMEGAEKVCSRLMSGVEKPLCFLCEEIAVLSWLRLSLREERLSFRDPSEGCGRNADAIFFSGDACGVSISSGCIEGAPSSASNRWYSSLVDC